MGGFRKPCVSVCCEGLAKNVGFGFLLPGKEDYKCSL